MRVAQLTDAISDYIDSKIKYHLALREADEDDLRNEYSFMNSSREHLSKELEKLDEELKAINWNAKHRGEKQ